MPADIAGHRREAHYDRMSQRESAMSPIIRAITLLLLFGTVSAEIYRSTDEQGNTVFSDTPSPNSEAVELPQPNTTPAVDPSDAPQQSRSNNDIANAPTIRITTPSNGAILPNGRLPTAVRIDSNRPLGKRYTLTLIVDGQSRTLPTATPVEHRIPLLSRGPHSLEAILKTSDGMVVNRHKVDIIVRWPGS